MCTRSTTASWHAEIQLHIPQECTCANFGLSEHNLGCILLMYVLGVYIQRQMHAYKATPVARLPGFSLPTVAAHTTSACGASLICSQPFAILHSHFCESCAPEGFALDSTHHLFSLHDVIPQQSMVNLSISKAGGQSQLDGRYPVGQQSTPCRLTERVSRFLGRVLYWQAPQGPSETFRGSPA